MYESQKGMMRLFMEGYYNKIGNTNKVMNGFVDLQERPHCMACRDSEGRCESEIFLFCKSVIEGHYFAGDTKKRSRSAGCEL